MGKIIIPPLKFVLLLITSIAVFLVFVLIYNWGQWVSVSTDVKNSLLLFLPNTAHDIILPAASAALLFTFFGQRRKKIHPVSVIIIFAAVFFFIFSAFRFSANMELKRSDIAFQPFNSRKLHTTESGIIYTDYASGDGSGRIEGVLLRVWNTEPPAFRYFPEGRITTNGQSALELNSVSKIPVIPDNPIFHSTFSPDNALAVYISDIGFLNDSLRSSAGSGDLIIYTVVFSAFLTASLLFRGFSVWPLLDIVLILSFHRLVFYIYRLFSTEADFIAETLFGGTPPADIPLMTVGAATVIVILLGLLLKLSGRRKIA